ncbi:MAG: hypothetical protein H6621_07915 [Halobacteriovoraceae bacterium]|nr:hypothetical protein [Halobacteriovoraceae bacterium]
MKNVFLISLFASLFTSSLCRADISCIFQDYDLFDVEYDTFHADERTAEYKTFAGTTDKYDVDQYVVGSYDDLSAFSMDGGGVFKNLKEYMDIILKGAGLSSADISEIEALSVNGDFVVAINGGSGSNGDTAYIRKQPEEVVGGEFEVAQYVFSICE